MNDTILEILNEADEQVNIRGGALDYAWEHSLPLPEDEVDWTPAMFLAWMIHDGDMHHQMANDPRYPPLEQSCYWQYAALLRKYAVLLLLQGVQPSSIAWPQHA